jgi:hypothetical protein
MTFTRLPAAWPGVRLRGPSAAGLAGHLQAAASVSQVISNATAWLTGILAGLATLFLTYGAVRYLMAGSDPADHEKARSALRSAAVGYALAILAPVIVAILRSLVGG